MKFADIVSALGLLQGVVLGIVILLAHREDRPTQLLGLFVLTISLRVVPFLLIRLPYGIEHPIVLYLPLYFWYLTIPLLYLYTLRLTDRLRWDRHWIHLMPGLFEFFLFSAIYLLELLNAGPFFDAEFRSGLLGVHSIVAIAPTVGYSYYIFMTLHRHRRYLMRYYSNLEGKHLAWIRNTVYCIVGLAASYSLLRHGPLPLPREPRILFGAVGNTLLIYYITINGIRQLGLKHAETVEEDATPVVESADHGDRETDYAALLASVDRRLTASQDYLDPNLTIAHLARETSMSERTLSRIINTAGGQHFNGYINAHRVAAARKLLRNPAYDHYTMEGIAVEVGFNNKSTFYKAFRQDSKLSPAAFRRQRREVGAE